MQETFLIIKQFLKKDDGFNIFDHCESVMSLFPQYSGVEIMCKI